MIAIAVACAVGCAVLVLIAAAQRRTGHPEQSAQQATPPTGRTREEDRIRPAVDASGTPVWVDRNHVEWHEIVSWPAVWVDEPPEPQVKRHA